MEPMDSRKVTIPVVKPDLLDKHIDECSDFINTELAKGINADTKRLIILITIVNGLFHGNDRALCRITQKIHSRWIDENHERFVDIKKNVTTQWLQAGAGSIGLAGTVFATAMLMAGIISGVNPGDVLKILDAPKMIFDGMSIAIGKFGDSSASGDQARALPLEHLMQVYQREISEMQSNAQNAQGHESDNARRLKDFFEAIERHTASMQRATASAQ